MLPTENHIVTDDNVVAVIDEADVLDLTMKTLTKKTATMKMKKTNQRTLPNLTQEVGAEVEDAVHEVVAGADDQMTNIMKLLKNTTTTTTTKMVTMKNLEMIDHRGHAAEAVEVTADEAVV